jgi:hypothetical protein
LRPSGVCSIRLSGARGEPADRLAKVEVLASLDPFPFDAIEHRLSALVRPIIEVTAPIFSPP